MIRYYFDRFSDCVFEVEFGTAYNVTLKNKKNTSIEYFAYSVQPEKLNRFLDMLANEFDVIEIK